MDPETHVGSLISREHMQKVLNFIEAGKKAGANLLCGGEQVTSGDLAKGNFIQPAVFSGCKDDMDIVNEEDFWTGNVLCSPFPTRTKRASFSEPTQPRTAWPPEFSLAIFNEPIGWLRNSRPAPAGSIITTSLQLKCPLAAINSPVLGAKTV